MTHKVTIGFTYYDNYEGLLPKLEAYKNIPADIILVDDGSPVKPLERKDILNHWRLFRITEDIGWNNEGARNLIAHHATTEWIIFHDMDTHVAETSFDILKNIDDLELDINNYYQLFETNIGRGSMRESKWFSHNHILVNRDKFLEYGGYNETYNGYYGFDEGYNFRQYMVRNIIPEIECHRDKEGATPDDRKNTMGRNWEHGNDPRWPEWIETKEKLLFPWVEIK